MAKKFYEILKENPELEKNENYSPEGFAKATEDMLRMQIKKGGLKLIPANKENKYEIDGKIVNKYNKEILKYEVERDSSGKCFDSDGKFVYWNINVLKEKLKRFTESTNPTIFIKVSYNAKFVALVRGSYIIKKNNEAKVISTKINEIPVEREIIPIPVSSQHVVVGKTENICNLIRKLFPLAQYMVYEEAD